MSRWSGAGVLPLELARDRAGSVVGGGRKQGWPARPRNDRGGAIAQAASIIVFGFLDAVCQIGGVGRVVAVLQAAVVDRGRILTIALFAACRAPFRGRQRSEHQQNAANENRVPQRRLFHRINSSATAPTNAQMLAVAIKTVRLT